jgi:anhydro-N-acetylmuramic acid kinase
VIVPNDDIVEYKEALAFALLGILRVKNQTNVLSSHTGAEKDSVSGSLYGNFSKLI